MIDLHTHSTFSDGTLSPEELISLSVKCRLDAVALCDHNTVAGLPRFLAAAEGENLLPIPGIEFSTDYRGTELHILGLFIDPEHYPAVTEKVNTMLLQKEESNRNLIRALNNAGISLDYDQIAAGTPSGQVNRAVIAAEMVRRGYCRTVNDCFSRWLSPKLGYYVPPARLDVFEIISFINSIGAVSVLAHPFLNLDEEGLRQFLKQAVPCGLDAMEVFYTEFSPEQRDCACAIAGEFGLALSGGSDFHGDNKPDTRLGTGKGDLLVANEVLDALISCRENKKSINR